MIIGSGLIDYLRAILIAELLSAGPKPRKCLECERMTFRMLKPASRFARCRRLFCRWRMNVFRSWPDADEACRKRTQGGKPLKQSEQNWQ